jgi:hypothetical protein
MRTIVPINFRITGHIRGRTGSTIPSSHGGRTSPQPRPLVFMAAATVPLFEGAAALVLGTGFFGFLVSRFPRFFSVAMVLLLDVLRGRPKPSLPSDRGLVRRLDRGRERSPDRTENGDEAIAGPELGAMAVDQPRRLPPGVTIVAGGDDAGPEHAAALSEPMHLIGTARVPRAGLGGERDDVRHARLSVAGGGMDPQPPEPGSADPVMSALCAFATDKDSPDGHGYSRGLPRSRDLRRHLKALP